MFVLQILLNDFGDNNDNNDNNKKTVKLIMMTMKMTEHSSRPRGRTQALTRNCKIELRCAGPAGQNFISNVSSYENTKYEALI